MTAACSSCPATLGPKNKSGYCRSCVAKRLNADPAVAELRRAGIARKMAEPEHRAACIARLVERNSNLTEAERERRREHGRKMAPIITAAARSMSAEIRAANGRKRSATALAWCPPEWRAHYLDLTKRGRRAPEAKRIVLGMIAGRPAPMPYAQQKAKLAWCPEVRRDEYRKLQKSLGSAEARRIIEADMSPFERQLAKVASGAGLVPAFKPTTTGHAFTLGGVATGMI